MAEKLKRSTPWRIGAAATFAALALAAGLEIGPRASAGETARALPPAAVDEQPGAAKSEVAVLAGGCFWGVQGVFQHVDGVTSAVSGYAGGRESTAHYDWVSTGTTGHAESVKVTFDPSKVSYGHILQVYFSVAHDPTEINRQGPDEGTQYRSAIFPVNDEQARIAKAYIAQLDAAHVFGREIATKIEPDKTFFPAEAYHQDYLTRHPTYPYIVYNDLPKIENLRRIAPELYRADPVLVGTADATE
ncbi:MAG TPA: peptide-methionine (S)-S-oxide reductase MsrA [Stellaceae bacterium]|nr:peptide-methionine (S)-S-oxide reductase MsrA [Stellaceae bacterium]